MTSRFRVSGMRCAHCKEAVEDGVRKIPGVESARVDLKSGSLTIEHESDPAFVETVKTCVARLGFSAEPCDEAERAGVFGALRTLLKRR